MKWSICESYASDRLTQFVVRLLRGMGLFSMF